MTKDDMALVREFAASGSEPAFETLVTRHIHLVHSAALRRTGDPHLAEEITQAVFIVLAQKAKTLSDKIILSGWLYRTTVWAKPQGRWQCVSFHGSRVMEAARQ